MSNPLFPLPQQFRTSAHLLAPTLEEHYARFSQFFLHGEKILDIGAGARQLEHAFRDMGYEVDSLDHEYSRSYDWSPTTLTFTEVIGYMESHEFVEYLRTFSPNKVVIKDFWSFEVKDATTWNYNFSAFRQWAHLALISMGYNSLFLNTFISDTTRWRKLLETIPGLQLPVVQAQQIILVATKDSIL